MSVERFKELREELERITQSSPDHEGDWSGAEDAIMELCFENLSTILAALEIAEKHQKREEYRERVRKFCERNNITPTPNNAEVTAISGQRFEDDLPLPPEEK